MLGLHLFWVLGGLLLAQSIWSLIDGYKFLDYLRRSQGAPLSSYQPRAALIVPCKGLDAGFEQNIASYLQQDYLDYEVIFVVRAEDDPAFAVLRRAVADHSRTGPLGSRQATLVVAGTSKTAGEKVHNLLAALTKAGSGVKVLAFADSDACPCSGWLRALISPLSDSVITVSSGFRWYLPAESFASRLQSAWDSMIVTTLGDHRRNIAWGGSMAMRLEDFRRMKIAEKYWQGTVSDDYGITRAVHDFNGSIRFEPRCLVPTESDTRLGGVLRWTNRQIILTRVYAPRLWLLGMTSLALYAVGIVTGIVALGASGLSVAARLEAAALLVSILFLGLAKGRLRLTAALEAFPQQRKRLEDYGACYWQLTLVTPWVMLWNFSVAAFARRIEWRGTVYQLKSPNQICVIRRSAS
jgi:ceramide glucosyltransferase